jgi:hypothetical protein
MEALQPYFQEERVYFDPDVKTMPELEAEILSFPFNMSNDDGMDCLSEICDPAVSRRPVFKEAPKQTEKDIETLQTEAIDRAQTAESASRRANCAAHYKHMRNGGEPVRETAGMVAGYA